MFRFTSHMIKPQSRYSWWSVSLSWQRNFPIDLDHIV